jgi:SRSO17 transposase
MKKFFLLVCFVSSLFAVGTKISHIPAAKTVFIDLDESVCDEACLASYLQNNEIFSFLSKYHGAVEDEEIKNRYIYFQALFRIVSDESMSIKVAILVPQKSIRRYAITTVNSIVAYMLSKNHDFEVSVFNSIDEEESSIKEAIEEIKRQNHQYVIAPVTIKGAQELVKYSQNLLIYIPTLHLNEFNNLNSNIIFGGIDYEEQVSRLLKYSNSKVSLFWDGSLLGENLNEIIKKQVPHISYEQAIDNSKVNFKRIFKDNNKLNNSSIFLNTPLVRTSLIASQLRFYEREPYSLLSTQINYNPLILTLTQFEDREKLYIANSIGKTSTKLEEINALFGHNIVYDWVNYSASIGVDYIYTRHLLPTENQEFREKIEDNQVIYDISIVKPKRYKFEKELF